LLLRTDGLHYIDECDSFLASIPETADFIIPSCRPISATQAIPGKAFYVKKPECPALQSGDEWPSGLEPTQPPGQDGFFFRRSPVLQHGVLHFSLRNNNAGFIAEYKGPDELEKKIANDYESIKKVVKAAGLGKYAKLDTLCAWGFFALAQTPCSLMQGRRARESEP
jgi:hypothetical protein